MKRGLLVAAAIVVVANGLALAGVAYNRSTGVHRIVLTEAEMPRSYDYGDSGALRLMWLAGLGLGSPAFSEAKMRAAGFDLPPVSSTSYLNAAALGRAVAVALEVGGEAHQAWLNDFYAHAQPPAAPPPSRLVVVDIGRDFASMRAAHPDSDRTFIMWGLVVPVRWTAPGGTTTWQGNLSTLLPNDIHLPIGMRDAVTTTRSGEVEPHYDVVLCIGARGEPWIESVTARGRR